MALTTTNNTASAGSQFIITNTTGTSTGTIYSRAGDYDVQISTLQSKISLLEHRLNNLEALLAVKDKEIRELKQKEIDDELSELRKRISSFKLLG